MSYLLVLSVTMVTIIAVCLNTAPNNFQWSINPQSLNDRMSTIWYVESCDERQLLHDSAGICQYIAQWLKSEIESMASRKRFHVHRVEVLIKNTNVCTWITWSWYILKGPPVFMILTFNFRLLDSLVVECGRSRVRSRWSLAVVAGMKKTNDHAEPTNVKR